MLPQEHTGLQVQARTDTLSPSALQQHPPQGIVKCAGSGLRARLSEGARAMSGMPSTPGAPAAAQPASAACGRAAGCSRCRPRTRQGSLASPGGAAQLYEHLCWPSRLTHASSPPWPPRRRRSAWDDAACEAARIDRLGRDSVFSSALDLP